MLIEQGSFLRVSVLTPGIKEMTKMIKSKSSEEEKKKVQK